MEESKQPEVHYRSIRSDETVLVVLIDRDHPGQYKVLRAATARMTLAMVAPVIEQLRQEAACEAFEETQVVRRVQLAGTSTGLLVPR